MTTQALPSIFVKGVEDGPLALFSQVGHDLGQNQWPKTDQESNQVWVVGLRRQGSCGMPKQGPNHAIDANVDSETRFWKAECGL